MAAVFSGHLHRYERRVVGGVLQFVVGTGGEGPGDERFTKATPDAVTSLLDYGALRVNVGADGVQYRFVDERGRVLDRAGEPAPVRIVCVVVAVAACVLAVAIGQPDVYGPLALCALVMFIVGAGSIAADAFPLRSRLALVCSALTRPRRWRSGWPASPASRRSSRSSRRSWSRRRRSWRRGSERRGRPLLRQSPLRDEARLGQPSRATPGACRMRGEAGPLTLRAGGI